MKSMKPKPIMLQRSAPGEEEDDMIALFEQIRINNEAVVADAAPVSPSDFVSLQSIRCSALARRPNTTMKFSRFADTLLSDLLNRDCVISDADSASEKGSVVGEKKTSLEGDSIVAAKKSENAKQDNEKTVERDKKQSEKSENPDNHENKEHQKDTISEELANNKDDATNSANDTENEEKEGELLSRGPVRNARNWGSHHHPYATGELQYGAAALSTVQDYTAFSNYGGGYECGITWGDSPDQIGCLSQSSTPDTMISDQGYSSSSPVLTSPGKHCQDQNISITQDIDRLLNCKELPDRLADFILKFSHTDNERPNSNNSAYNESPDGPMGCQSGPTTPGSTVYRSNTPKSDGRMARMALRNIIPEDEFEKAWAWALVNQSMIYDNRGDADGDTLLHILVNQQDIPKIYALIEHLIKHDAGRNSRQYDKPNKDNETPFFVAVIRGNSYITDYLLELGVDCNIRSYRGDQDAPLHNAASRGKLDISLCKYPSIDLNAVNARGQTALLCAIRSHGAIDEESNSRLDNSEIIKFLLTNNADPTITDYNGRTIVHYIIETGEPELLDLFRRNVDDGKVTTLVNQEDYSGTLPMKMVHDIPSKKDRTAMVLPMLTCGAGLV
ncbi:unnamed protein product [Auanema sp. JU1783]|nr:unnamed protein product [Auanema sp. JU1783]